MEHDKDLQKQLELLKASAPVLLTIEDVSSGLAKRKSSYIKYIKIMGVLVMSSLLIGAFFYNQSHASMPTVQDTVWETESRATGDSVKIENTAIGLLNAKSDTSRFLEYTTVSYTKCYDPSPEEFFRCNLQNSNEDLAKENSVSLPVSIQSTATNASESGVMDSGICRFLILGDTDLYKLGIVSKENGIFYEEINSKTNPYSFSKVKSGLSTRWQHSGGGINILRNLDKYPYLITDFYLKTASGVLNRKSLKDTMPLLENREAYLPLLVYFKTESNQIDTTDGLIFWLLNNDYFFGLLPEWARANIQMKKDYYSWDLKTNRQYDNTQKLFLAKVSEADTLQKAIQLVKPQKYLELKEERLPYFGFKREENQWISIRFKARKYHFNEFFRDGIHYIDFFVRDSQSYERAVKKCAFPLPLFITDSMYSLRNSFTALCASKDKVNVFQMFLNQKHQLVPVKIRINANDVKYYWYRYNSDFVNAISSDEDAFIRNSGMLDVSGSDKSVTLNTTAIDMPTLEEIYHKGDKKFQATASIELSEEVLSRAGFKNVDNNLTITVPDTLNKTIILTLYRHGTGVENGTADESVIKQLVMPVYISDDLGKYTYVYYKSDESKDTSVLDFDRLVAVKFKTGRSYSMWDMVNQSARPDYLLWFKPSEAFLNLLTEDQRKQMVQELRKDSLANRTCTYTDLCKEQKVEILDIKVFPNPGHGLVNLKVDAKSPIGFSYAIADLSGKSLLQGEVSPEASASVVEINLTDFESGIYNLFVYSKNGDMFVRKIVVSR